MEFSTCRYCHQAIFSELLPIGPAYVADDGWGSICGDAPQGSHEPVDLAVSIIDFVPVAGWPTRTARVSPLSQRYGLLPVHA